MRTALLLLLILASASAQDVKPAVTLGSTALRGESNIHTVFFTADSERIGTFEPGHLRYWSLSDGRFLGQRDHGFFKDSDKKAVGSSDGSRVLMIYQEGGKTTFIHTLSTSSLTPSRERKLPDRIDAYFVSENARLLAVEKAGTTTVIDLDDASISHVFSGIENLRRFSASSDGRVFAFCNRDGKLDVRAAGTGSWTPAAIMDYRFASVAVSADGKLLATACFREDEKSGSKSVGPIEVWSLADHKRVALCEAVEWFAEYPNRLRFSPDGKQVFAGDGAYIRGWDITTGKKVFAVEPGWNYPGALTISPDGKYIAVAYATRAMVWDIATGKPPRGFEGHPASVWEIVFSADGKRAATASYGLQQVLVWDPQTGRVVSDLNVPYRKGKSKTTKPLGQSNSSSMQSERLEMMVNQTADVVPGLATAEEERAMIPGRIRMAFNSDGTMLATVNEATGSLGPLRFWGVNTSRMMQERGYKHAVAPDFAFVGKRLALYPGPDNVAVLADPTAPDFKLASSGVVRSLIVNQRRDRIAVETTTQSDNPVFNDQGDVLDRFDGVPYAFSPDGKKLIVLKLGPTMTDGRFVDLVITRDIATKKDTNTISVPMGTLKGRLSPDATVLADEKPANPKDAFAFRDLATNRVISIAARVDRIVDETQFKAMVLFDSDTPHSPGPAAFTPDGRLFAVAYKTGQLAVWDIASGETLFQTLTGCVEPRFVTFNPDGRTVFITSGEGAGSPVYGYDCTGGARDHVKPADKDLPALLMELKGKPAAARRAIHLLARRPDKVAALSKAITDPATDADAKNYDTWIADLDAVAFRDREAATVALFNAGWRAEAKLQAALATTRSDEARERLQDLLAKPDYRRTRVVHLLELAATPEAKTLLAELTVSKDATTAREAKKAIARLP
ncbi:hypothetical protein BH11PLA2_BH11PLA2_13930 [soil metagenome]